MDINCRGKLLNLETPKIMGILNLTPDSFFDGGRHNNLAKAIAQTSQMLEEGADIIDVGGQSTRPGADFLSAEEEMAVVLPILEELVNTFPLALFSIDTFWSAVARQAVEKGVAIVNDVSAGKFDEQMFETIAELNVPYVLMHMQGKPQTMKNQTVYRDILLEINQFFADKIARLQSLGVNDIILDPGYGFGKTTTQNYEILKNQKLVGWGEFPILSGISRKSMIYKTLNTTAQEALNGTTALHMIALQNGANLLRVHDVKAAYECVLLWGKLKR